MESGIAALADLERYPLHALDGERGRELLDRARKAFEHTGFVALPGFLHPDAARVVASQCLADEGRGVRFDGTSDVFLKTEDGAQGHTGTTYTKTTLPYDRIRPDSPLHTLYAWEPLRAFVAAVVGLPVHRCADPAGAVAVQIQHEGDLQDWHFDICEYTVLLHAQAPTGGGTLQYAVRSRTQVRHSPDLLRRIVTGDRGVPVTEVPTAAGTLAVHAGSISMHRVTPVVGDTARVSAVLTYNSRPGQTLNPYTRQIHYGRDR
ncbi:hypothetical protein ACIG5E_37885 [Kitasatospora sp. NPDC053057]|uniref:HalD/BesD family halogenase n=1 Tax=Kitasatospora sp. NPDC053057 TaxID=3364062 RepID=UPI0037C67A85